MTVQTNTSVARFEGNGTTQIFPIGFKFNSDTDLGVLLIDDEEGTSRLLSLNSDYTVSGEGDENGGLINVVVAPTTSQRLIVSRVMAILQLTDLRNQGKFFPEVHEDVFDLLVMIDQQQQEQIDRSLKVPAGSEEPPEQVMDELFNARDVAVQAANSAGQSATVSSQQAELAEQARIAAEEAAQSADAKVLREALAALTGAGLIGYDFAESYLQGTLGYALQSHIVAGIPGATGDGVQDDTLAILNSLAASARTGRLVFDKSKTYRVTGQFSLVAPVKVDLNASTLKFEFDDTLQNGVGFNVQSNNIAIENGEIRITGTTVGLASSAHVPIYGGRENTGEGWSGIVIRNLRLSTQGNGGVVFMGANRDAIVENIEIEDSAGIRVGVAFEWGGTPELGTGHPHNITIRNIKAGKFTYPGDPSSNHTCVVWISSAFNVAMENISADEVPTLVNVFTGDKSNLHAPSEYKNLIGANITLDNAACDSITGHGIRVYGKGTDSPTPLAQSVKIKGLRLKAAVSAASGNMGMLLEYCDGVTLDGFTLDGFHHAVATGPDVRNPCIENGDAINSKLLGVQIGSSGYPTINPVIRNVRLHGNNSQNTSGINTSAAIRLTDSRNATVEGCRFGREGEAETQRYSIYVTNQASRPRLNDNHTHALASGGVAYVIGDSQADTAINASGMNNTVSGALLIHGGAPIFSIQPNGERFFVAEAVPTTGSFSRGDRCYFNNPSAGGFIGASCMVAGTPGTWKNFGAIEA